ncbi:MsnO8 family LLM class oxidoreductase [Pseudokineococcus marinus]|uniref:MsnO8 family LLM class oxidoreductase n=1 Tax=Pseudokineococcus marinus TaxID=351215 RepID=A0A849BYD0_9ACTN|nr:MsnO8 family LLM class oxidoreductase [Pseudokineococcus marinus]NNH22528.1 MsnO8 family LLM class oxidoreductase [Pseudokineococcus marinus]
MLDVPLSLLDRARTRTGEPDALALTGVVERARRSEALGLRRSWVAEHHAVPGVAGSAPAVLAGAVLAATAHLRVGSGGVMLPNHAPLVVAEQFATLAALHPGRVDLGVGRSPGFTAPVRRALRREGVAADDDAFERDLEDLRTHLDGTAEVTARPQGTDVPLLVLATGAGLGVAARLGLPVVVGGPLLAPLLADGSGDGAAAEALAALADYRRDFRPSPRQPHPLVLVALDVLVAHDAGAAADLALPEAWAMAEARTRGAFPPLEPVEVLRHRRPTGSERRHLEAAGRTTVTGAPDEVERVLARLVDATGAEEVMATSSTTDRAALATSDALLASLSAPAVVAARERAAAGRT